MNVQQFILDTLEIPPNLVKDVVQSILHSVMFTRAFGLVRPAEGIIDLLEFYYVRCEDKTIESYINSKTDEFFESWQKKKFDPPKTISIIVI